MRAASDRAAKDAVAALAGMAPHDRAAILARLDAPIRLAVERLLRPAPAERHAGYAPWLAAILDDGACAGMTAEAHALLLDCTRIALPAVLSAPVPGWRARLQQVWTR